MEKYITDEHTGLKYECRRNVPQEYGDKNTHGYLKENHKVLYMNLLTSGKLNDYLADLNEQAENMFFRLVKKLAEKEGITETLKAEDQMLWVQRMNAVRETATEIVNNDLIYA